MCHGENIYITHVNEANRVRRKLEQKNCPYMDHEEKSAVWHLQRRKSVDLCFFTNAPHFSCPHVKCFCTDSQNISPKVLFFLSKKKTICTERWKSKSTNKSELISFFLFLSSSVENVFYKHALISSPHPLKMCHANVH